jgi:hypothetical protein
VRLVTAADPAAGDPARTLSLAMLQEIFDLGIEAAGEIWPTPTMALSRLFERGVSFLASGGSLAPVAGRASPDLLDAMNITREDLFLVEALYLLTRHVAFTLTEASNALEATWLGLADRHLAIRAEIVEQRRAEEQLKRELRALGGAAVPLPEHDDLPMTDGDRPRKSRGMFQDLFRGVSVVEVDLEISGSALQAADRVAEERGWVQEWGEDARLLVLTHGISLTLREREADEIRGDDEDSVKAGQDASRARLVRLEGRYSTLRRRLFELRHNNRILQWRITALEVEAVGMRSRLDQFLVDRDRLEQAIAERRASGAVIREESGHPGNDGWRRRLGRLFGRGD